ncbi:MAG: hypothetical protein RQ885_05305 [Desulfurococcales archaeon]|nr:hypothetical protein [Desulfurococcales archaeon]
MPSYLPRSSPEIYLTSLLPLRSFFPRPRYLTNSSKISLEYCLALFLLGEETLSTASWHKPYM